MNGIRDKFRSGWVRWSLLILVFLLITGAGCFSVLYHSLHTASKGMLSPLDRDKSAKRSEEVRIEEKDPFSVLVLGVDEREGDAGRSDTMMVVIVNPADEKTNILSIPRDTYTEIAGYGTKDKINHAYAYGGVEMAMSTVENMLDIPIDYYVKVNMEGFEDIIDLLGGVTVDNTFEFTAGGFQFPKGKIIMNGKQALSYSRMRAADPNGDFGRQERQRNVIQSIIKEGTTLSAFFNSGNILQTLGENVKTNLTFDQLIGIQNDYKSATQTIQQLSLEEGTNQSIKGVYYYVIPEEEIAAASKILRGELGF
ncbi:LCP family protein [Jeotgalibacillus proteolyticus]|uniref:LytR family transcriptional regulator n=1 Tax=Jeotgalibacillus proteolyticus TaxID=2082395 RepID=A0A2S5GBX2_9BACL|nr:LCP family protein [Jeotgalibacillus proteolyticus]PPA70414.1 LytR family transcriptional regulator [Jeotgalibacillus proteolyticus]